MELKDFETLFHLCVLFNFLYAAVENFSNKLQMFFYEPLLNIGKRTISLISKIVQVRVDTDKKNKDIETQTQIINYFLEKYFVRIWRRINRFTDPSKLDLEYGEKFKSIYLLSGFFSFFLILLIGFENYFNLEKIYNCLFIIDCFLSLIILYVLSSTFFKKIKRLIPLYVLMFFILGIIIFNIFYLRENYILFYIPNKNCTIFFTVTLVLLPFLLHFGRILFQVVYIESFLLFLRVTNRKKIKSILEVSNDNESYKDLMKFLERNKYPTSENNPIGNSEKNKP